MLDSVGCGDAPDASNHGDVGSTTSGNIAQTVEGFKLPNLGKLGLGNLTQIKGVQSVQYALGAYGRLTDVSPSRDTITGHWELAGIILDQLFPTYNDRFLKALLAEFETLVRRET